MPELDCAGVRTDMEEARDSRLLLAQIAAGDREAFHAFYGRYGARVMALVRSRVFEPQLAEELVQDVFVAAWLGARGYRSELGEPEFWLLGIARHKLQDHGRRMRRVAVTVSGPLDSAASPATLPADARLILEHALAGLTADQRRLVDLIYLAGLTFAEAARTLNLPVGTVKSRVSAALRRMRAALTGAKTS